MPEHRPQWTCPRCGNTFVTPNLSHSCVVVDLDTHFAGRPLRFGSVLVRRQWLDCGLWLTRVVHHPLLRTVDDLGPAQYHWFRLTDAGQLDSELAALVKDAYQR